MKNSKNNDALKKNLHSFPYISLITTFTLTVVTIIWLGANNYIALNMLETSVQDSIKIANLTGKIMLYQEALSTSTQMGVMTGNKEWEERYNYYNPLLCSALSEAAKLAPNPPTSDTGRYTNLANKKLSEIERETFELCKTGKIDKARKILDDPTYKELKLAYKENLDKYHLQLENLAKEKILEQIKIQEYFQIIALINLIIIIIAWISTFRKIYSWKLELDENSDKEIQYQMTLQKSNSALEEILKVNDIISDMSDKLQTCQHTSEAYPLALHAVTKLFPYLSGGLSAYNHTEGKILTMKQWGDHQLLKSNFLTDDCWGIRTGHPHIVNTVTKQITCNHFETPPSGDTICIPMALKNGTTVLFTLIAEPGLTIPNYQIQHAIKFAEEFKLCLNNILDKETLSEKVHIDSLTGLHNRRYLDEALPAKVNSALSSHSKICVAIVDIDNFKDINDKRGHDIGDEALRHIGRILKSKFRNNDSVFRFGGEEFIIIIDAGMNVALTRLEQFKQELKSDSTYLHDTESPRISVSIGVIEVPTNAATIEDIIHKADKALYQAKSAGKDRIVIAQK